MDPTHDTGAIVIAPDKFKGSLAAGQVADALATGLRRVLPSTQLRCIPVADGGEGTVEAAITAGFERRTTMVTGPIEQPVEASWAFLSHETRSEAVIELAQASGIELIQPSRSTSLLATSRGTGELLQAALDAGARRIILGLGGSACTDGGAGMLAALGVGLEDDDGAPIPDGGGNLGRLRRVDFSTLDPGWADVEVLLASDVDNPLLGTHGAAMVFGPQKGVFDDDLAALDASIGHYAELLAEAASAEFSPPVGQHIRDCITHPGAGAAGGAGFAAMAVLHAQRRRGVDVVLDFVDFSAALDGASMVITGEGSLDAQTLSGKTPVGIAQAAARRGVPVIAVCGRSLLSEAQAQQAGFDRIISLSSIEPDQAKSMSQATPLLKAVGEQIGDILVTNQHE